MNDFMTDGIPSCPSDFFSLTVPTANGSLCIHEQMLADDDPVIRTHFFLYTSCIHSRNRTMHTESSSGSQKQLPGGFIDFQPEGYPVGLSGFEPESMAPKATSIPS